MLRIRPFLNNCRVLNKCKFSINKFLQSDNDTKSLDLDKNNPNDKVLLLDAGKINVAKGLDVLPYTFPHVEVNRNLNDLAGKNNHAARVLLLSSGTIKFHQNVVNCNNVGLDILSHGSAPIEDKTRLCDGFTLVPYKCGMVEGEGLEGDDRTNFFITKYMSWFEEIGSPIKDRSDIKIENDKKMGHVMNLVIPILRSIAMDYLPENFHDIIPKFKIKDFEEFIKEKGFPLDIQNLSTVATFNRTVKSLERRGIAGKKDAVLYMEENMLHKTINKCLANISNMENTVQILMPDNYRSALGTFIKMNHQVPLIITTMPWCYRLARLDPDKKGTGAAKCFGLYLNMSLVSKGREETHHREQRLNAFQMGLPPNMDERFFKHSLTVYLMKYLSSLDALKKKKEEDEMKMNTALMHPDPKAPKAKGSSKKKHCSSKELTKVPINLIEIKAGNNGEDNDDEVSVLDQAGEVVKDDDKKDLNDKLNQSSKPE